MNNGNISLEQAKTMAQQDLQCNDKRIILKIRETDDLWIFEAGIPGVVSYGGRNTISINKATGEIKLFVLPNNENFEILKKANIVYEYSKNATNNSTDSYNKGPMLPKEFYERIQVDELMFIYQALVDHYYHFNSKEEQIESMIKDFTANSNYVIREHGKKMIESVLTEKTGKVYTINTDTFDITLNDVINYANKDPYFVKAISDFFNKLENVSDEDKLFFMISLCHDENAFNEFTKEISSSQDAEALFNKYKNAGMEYELRRKQEQNV